MSRMVNILKGNCPAGKVDALIAGEVDLNASDHRGGEQTDPTMFALGDRKVCVPRSDQ